ncbi:MAG: hydrogenase nickel incorporation protein HypB [Hyphomicrobium sp.]|nr:hydrogenase nickel incorporation protein HypB [Hyphomicrobium sp.]
MCTVCGCSAGETRIEKAGAPGAHAHAHEHTHADGTTHVHAHSHDDAGIDDHSHDHDHHHHHHHGEGAIDYGQGPARAHAPGMSQARMVAIEQDILAKNNAYAAVNRALFNARGILALNLVSSPGSGKTTLLVKTIERLKHDLMMCVIEGDQQTCNDAERIRATGVKALQVNTGKGCHLDAHMVGHAVEHLSPADSSVLFIENVGNLVCPAAFDLGEAHKVVILSVTEGEDKPLKYPDMFHAADLMILAKTDLLPHLDFDVGQTISNARKINPGIKVLQVSAKTGEGLDAWIQWIKAARALAAIGRGDLLATAAVQGS